MGRQYHSLQAELFEKITMLEKQNAELSIELEKEKLESSRMKESFERDVDDKQNEVEAVKDQLKAVNDQLERIVGRTVDRISKKIDQTSQKWRGDIPISPDVQRKLLDFKLGKLQL